MANYQFVKTSILEVGYLEWNPTANKTVVLVHGWPDSPESWLNVAPVLAAAGYRVVAPALRGFLPTRFLSLDTPRSGQLSALGRDLIELVDALSLQKPILVGHDWGARTVANACGLRPNMASHLVMLSVGYGTNDPHQSITFNQARNYWYHWFMATPRGQAAVELKREEFTKMMWETWAPGDWFSEEDFAVASKAFQGPDWAAVVLHSYRHRWAFVEGDAQYEQDEKALMPPPVLPTPTLVLHGERDTCNHPDSSKGREAFFSGRYERIVLDNIGHFPQREAPESVANGILNFIR
jgi:pimeloyl-ACP methyl ester carboxylesterase